MRRKQSWHTGDEMKTSGNMVAGHGWLTCGCVAIMVLATAVTAWGQFGQSAGGRSSASQRGWIRSAEKPVESPPPVAPSEEVASPVEEVLAPEAVPPPNEIVEQTDESLSEGTLEATRPIPEETVNESAEEMNKNASEAAGAAEPEAGTETGVLAESKSFLPEESEAEVPPEAANTEMQKERPNDATPAEEEPNEEPENETVGKEAPSDEAEPEDARPREEAELSPCLACILGEDEEICDEEGCPNRGCRHCDYQP